MAFLFASLPLRGLLRRLATLANAAPTRTGTVSDPNDATRRTSPLWILHAR
jgi:hypothetical protein